MGIADVLGGLGGVWRLRRVPRVRAWILNGPLFNLSVHFVVHSSACVTFVFPRSTRSTWDEVGIAALSEEDYCQLG